MTLWTGRRLVQWVMWVVLATYLAALSVPGVRFGVLPHALNVATQCLPALVCWLSVRQAGGRRREVVALAVAMSAFAAGNVVLAVAQARSIVLPVPSLADIGYMSFYPAALIAIGLAARHDHRGAGQAVWLDSFVGGLAAASAVAVVLRPAFINRHHHVLAATVSLAYPTADLLLVFAVVAVAALREWQLDRRWLSLLAGLLVFTTADVIYDLQIAAGSYTVETPLDGLWAVGLAVMSLWAATSTPEQGVVRTRRPVALAVSAAAASLSLAVLIVGTVTRIAVTATVLASLAIAGSVVRTQYALRYQQRLSDLRREARTLERLVAAQDAERARIADDVHDDSIQALAAVDLRLGALRRRLSSRAPDEVEGLDTVITSVHQAATRLRSLLFELETPALEAELPEALREATAHLFDESPTRHGVVEHGRSPLPPAVRVAAYRIAREAMVNVRKHAQAQELVVSVDAGQTGVRVDVVDDGVGVAATTSSATTRRRHSGVIGMRDRAAAAGGWWSSQAGPHGRGTRVSFFLPVPPSPARSRAAGLRQRSTRLEQQAPDDVGRAGYGHDELPRGAPAQQ